MESFVLFSDLVPITAPTFDTSPLKLLILNTGLLVFPLLLFLARPAPCKLVVVRCSLVSLLALGVVPPVAGSSRFLSARHLQSLLEDWYSFCLCFDQILI